MAAFPAGICVPALVAFIRVWFPFLESYPGSAVAVAGVRRGDVLRVGSAGIERDVIMIGHKFVVGQTVDLSFAPGEKSGGRGSYTVRRLMPVERNEVQYRVQNNTDGQERVVMESQLREAGPQFFKTEGVRLG